MDKDERLPGAALDPTVLCASLQGGGEAPPIATTRGRAAAAAAWPRGARILRRAIVIRRFLTPRGDRAGGRVLRRSQSTACWRATRETRSRRREELLCQGDPSSAPDRSARRGRPARDPSIRHVFLVVSGPYQTASGVRGSDRAGPDSGSGRSCFAAVDQASREVI